MINKILMAAKQVWISPDENGWKVHSAGTNRAAGFFDKKIEAVERGIEIAKNMGAELFVQNLDGTIGWKNSYGSDNFPPKG